MGQNSLQTTTLTLTIGGFSIAFSEVELRRLGGRDVVPIETLSRLQAVAARTALQQQTDDSAAISYARKLVGLLDRDFAKALGVSTETVTHWEKGQAVPSTREREGVIALLRRIEGGKPAVAGLGLRMAPDE